jgi:hypothetical protein
MVTAVRCLLALTFLVLWTVPASVCRAQDVWEPYRFLLGEWTGDGAGEPGKATGAFSFALDLQNKVLVRKNRAEFPAQAGRPAYVHEDLMVIYPGEGQGQKAIYWDTEGHVIHYSVKFSEDKQSLIFLSDTTPAAPRFRLLLTKEADGVIATKFEMASPGKPEDFKTFVEGRVHRQDRPKLEKAKK